MAQGIIFGQATGGGGLTSIVKSVQYGSIYLDGDNDVTATAALNAVVLANSVVMLLGSRMTFKGTSLNYQTTETRLELVNTTTVRATRDWDSDTDLTVQFVVMEYEDGVVKSNQSGSIHLNGDSELSDTAAISSVDTNKSMLVHRGRLPTGNNNDDFREMDQSYGTLVLTNATTVTSQRGATGSSSNDDLTQYFTVVEFN